MSCTVNLFNIVLEEQQLGHHSRLEMVESVVTESVIYSKDWVRFTIGIQFNVDDALVRILIISKIPPPANLYMELAKYNGAAYKNVYTQR